MSQTWILLTVMVWNAGCAERGPDRSACPENASLLADQIVEVEGSAQAGWVRLIARASESQGLTPNEAAMALLGFANTLGARDSRTILSNDDTPPTYVVADLAVDQVDTLASSCLVSQLSPDGTGSPVRPSGCSPVADDQPVSSFAR